jgi:uncharacterized Fe-S cluster protein YjdI
VSTIEEVPGQDVTILFDAKKCVHSRNCVLDRPDVFVPNASGAWIHPDAPTVDEVASLAHNCPSGAITGALNGPLLVSGNLEVVSGTGRTVNRCGKTALCRCGGSANKPYCDGTHKLNGFKA